MFTILMKDVDGRRFDRYFKSWEKAEALMMEEVKDIKASKGEEVLGEYHIDRMNIDAGFYEREETILIKGGKRYHFAILDGHFMDDVNNKEG